METIQVEDYENRFISLLPETYNLVKMTNLTIHPNVSRIILHGSRGLAGGFRIDSDIDLSLIVDIPPSFENSKDDSYFREVIDCTIQHWRSTIEADLAVIFDIRQCTLKCFEHNQWDENDCSLGGEDCFGLYKVQKGYAGLVTNAGIKVKLMYPCLKIWQRK